MDVGDLMATTFAVVSPEMSLAEAARAMIDADTGAAAVVADGALVGMISERDLLRCLSEYADAGGSVADRMTRHVLVGSSSTTVPEAMAMMVDGHVRHLPIIDHERVIGVASMRDMMVWVALRLRHGPIDDDEIDTAELLATIHRMRTGAA
jgi:CBS domain-containing protein